MKLVLYFSVVFVLLSSLVHAQTICGNEICETGEEVDCPQDCGAGCVEAWYCTDWSECTNGQQTRTCTDQNNCGTEFDKPPETRSCTEECTENWSCTEWSECIDGQQTRTCTDLNNCGTTVNKPAEIQSCTPTCTENWSCTDWGECVDNQQNRTCIDLNNCGTEIDKPSELKACDTECVEDWNCTEWGECVNNQQTRICIDLNGCGTELNKPTENQSCTAVQPAENATIAQLMEEALAAIRSAEQEINKASEEGRDVGPAEEKIGEARQAFDQTDYTSAKDFANQALGLAKTAPLIEGKREFPWMFLAGGVAIICIIMMIVFKKKQKAAAVETVMEKKPAVSEERLVQLLDYARKHLSAGYRPEQIKKSIIDAGYDAETAEYVVEKIIRERK